MRTYKENIIELEDGEVVTIRAAKDSNQKMVSIQIQCNGWYDYRGQPNGFEIATDCELRCNGEALPELPVEVVPPNLVLEPIKIVPEPEMAYLNQQ